MSLEFVVVTVVLGNLGCAVLGWLAGRAMGGGFKLDISSLQASADDAVEKLDRARQSAEESRSELKSASISDSPENELASILNENRREE
jgi:hypothetical protein